MTTENRIPHLTRLIEASEKPQRLRADMYRQSVTDNTSLSMNHQAAHLTVNADVVGAV